MASLKPPKWLRKLKPGNIVAPLVTRFVPGGSNIVAAVRNVQDAVKRTVDHRPVAFAAAARGVPASQVAAELSPIGPLPSSPSSSSTEPSDARPGAFPLIALAGVAFLAAGFLRGRR